MTLFEKVRARMAERYTVVVTRVGLGYDATFTGAPGLAIQPTEERARSSLLREHAAAMRAYEVGLYTQIPEQEEREQAEARRRAEEVEAARRAKEKQAEREREYAANVAYEARRRARNEEEAREEARRDAIDPDRVIRREREHEERRHREAQDSRDSERARRARAEQAAQEQRYNQTYRNKGSTLYNPYFDDTQ